MRVALPSCVRLRLQTHVLTPATIAGSRAVQHTRALAAACHTRSWRITRTAVMRRARSGPGRMGAVGGGGFSRGQASLAAVSSLPSTTAGRANIPHALIAKRNRGPIGLRRCDPHWHLPRQQLGILSREAGPKHAATLGRRGKAGDNLWVLLAVTLLPTPKYAVPKPADARTRPCTGVIAGHAPAAGCLRRWTALVWSPTRERDTL